MGEYADTHSKKERKDRVNHILKDDGKAIDASGYKVPGELDTEKKTGPLQPKPRAFAKGGKVEGKGAHHHAGRKKRDAGGQAALDQLRPNVPTGGLYGSGFQPTHAGMLSSAAGLKKGGMAKRHKRANGGEAAKQARANADYQSARSSADNANFFSAPFKEQDEQSAMDRMNDSADQTGYDSSYKRGGKAKKRAAGGILSDRPMADKGLTSYRAKGPYGHIMIGGKAKAEGQGRRR